ncbi:MAG: hypothetical protein HC767_00910 [Akkermansiaceae bacterium]|nr:hypothetical protein [Akkermansiaceae bacterium]
MKDLDSVVWSFCAPAKFASLPCVFWSASRGRRERPDGAAGHGVLQQLGLLLEVALKDGTLNCIDAMVSATALASFRSLPGKLLADLAEHAAQGADSCSTEQISNFLRLLASNRVQSGVTWLPMLSCRMQACWWHTRNASTSP